MLGERAFAICNGVQCAHLLGTSLLSLHHSFVRRVCVCMCVCHVFCAEKRTTTTTTHTHFTQFRLPRLLFNLQYFLEIRCTVASSLYLTALPYYAHDTSIFISHFCAVTFCHGHDVLLPLIHVCMKNAPLGWQFEWHNSIAQ